MIKNRNYYLRKSHRYLGVFLGIQFLLWTVGGLYFSWNNIDSVHGDHMRKVTGFLPSNLTVVSPDVAIKNLRATAAVDSLQAIHLIRILNKPTYQLVYFSGHTGEGMHHHVHHALADGETGQLRSPLTKEEAIAIAKENIVGGNEVLKIEYLENIDGHHEYRENPLPAWAISFKEPACTAYVSAELGTFQKIRHDQWRAFDFLYMLHTMDYKGRDDFNNLILKIFSLLGLITVISGFTLFYISSPVLLKLKRRLI